MEGESGSDCESEEDKGRHDQLLSAIGSLGGKKKKRQRGLASGAVSEFHLSQGEGGRVSVGDLLSGLEAEKGFGYVKKRLSSAENKTRLLPPPLSRPQADKIQRSVAYSETSKQVSKWLPIVKKNREADHLSFPLQEERLPPPSLTARTENFKPVTELELEISSVLEGSENVEKMDEELTEAERKALLTMNLEEARERHRELQKMRALMLYHEQKSRRIKKIKSKRFHRVQRRRREAASKGEEGEDAMERAERVRAEERMTLKHSNLSKWARQQLARGHRDPSTQQALTDHHQKRQDLTQKALKDPDTSDSVYSESDHSEDESTLQHTTTSGGNPWLGNSQRTSDPILLLDAPQGSLAVGEFDPQQQNEDPAGETSLVTRGRKTVKIVTEEGKTDGSSRRKERVIDPTSYMTMEEGVALGVASKHLLDVQEAFAGDDVVSEFVREKEEEVERGRNKDVDLTLPGWGVWGGKGVKPPRKRVRVIQPAEPQKPRRDAGLDHVIISEQRDKKVAKHQVSDLPWPYTSKSQFEKTHCTPVGRHWNSEATFQHLIAPRVRVAVGRVIEPMRLTEDVQDFMKRTEKRAGRKGRGGRGRTKE